MKKGAVLSAQLVLIIGFGALSVSLQTESASKIIFSACIILIGAALFAAAQRRASFAERQTLYKVLSAFSFIAANAFYYFAFCFDSKLHRYSLLYCAVTALLLMPAVLIYKFKRIE